VADAINHPPHYTAHPSGVEAIELTEVMGFCLGNALKYVWRAGLKGAAVEDLRKARWYVERARTHPTRPSFPGPSAAASLGAFLDAEPSVFVRGVAIALWEAACDVEPENALRTAVVMLDAEIALREQEPPRG
jgi:hypothetical protein